MPKLQQVGFKSPMPQSGKKNGRKRAILWLLIAGFAICFYIKLGLWVILQADFFVYC